MTVKRAKHSLELEMREETRLIALEEMNNLIEAWGGMYSGANKGLDQNQRYDLAKTLTGNIVSNFVDRIMEMIWN